MESPAALTVADGKMTATIVWSSPNYDYMIVDGEKYLPTNTEGNSTFEIPVSALDTALDVTADTVAMSTPHEIEYTLTFDSASLKVTIENALQSRSVAYSGRSILFRVFAHFSKALPLYRRSLACLKDPLGLHSA